MKIAAKLNYLTRLSVLLTKSMMNIQKTIFDLYYGWSKVFKVPEVSRIVLQVHSLELV